MQCCLVLVPLALLAGASEARRLLQDAAGPVTEIREEMRLKKAWNGDIADPDPLKDQKHLSKEVDRSNSPYRGMLPWDDDEPSINTDILDAMEKSSPLGAAASDNNPEKVRNERSVRSVKRQQVDADPKNTAPMFEVADMKEPDFFGAVFGKSPEQQRYGDLHRQLWDLAGAKAGHWGENLKPPEKITPWRPDVEIAMAQQGAGARDDEDEEEEDPTGGHKDFVAPCPLDSVLHPASCQPFITGGHPAVPKAVACPAIQSHCGTGSGSPMMSLRCNGSCCPVCWAPDHVIGADRHTSVFNEDVISAHPAAPPNCAGVKCFTPLCLRGYEAGHSPGACCASCKLAV